MADQKLTQLDPNAAPAAGDGLYLVDDFSGVPASQYVTVDNLLNTGLITALGTIASGDADAAVSAASTTVAGKIEIATGAETNTGTDATRAVSPDALEDWTGSAQITTVGTLANPGMTTPTIDTFEFGMGTAFPGGPGAGDAFFRTDLLWLCSYDGTRWVTAFELTAQRVAQTYSANGLSVMYRIRDDYAIYFERCNLTTVVATTNDGSNYWTVDVDSYTDNFGSATEIHTFDTSGDTADTNTSHDAVPATTQVPGNYGAIVVECTKTSTPGDISVFLDVNYRLIVT